VEDYKKAITEITELFEKKQIPDLDTSIEMAKAQLELLVSLFDISETEEDKQWSVKYSAAHLVPLLTKMLASPKVDAKKVEIVYTVYRRAYAFCGRRSLAHFIDFMEWDRPTSNKVFINRRETLNPIVYYLNKMTFDDKLNTFVFSLPPGYGKTFVLNYYSAWLYGVNINNSVLRMSYNDELLVGFSRSIKDLIVSDQFAEIFPTFSIYKNKPFDKEKDSDWKLKNADVIVSHYIRTRDGGTTGVRARTAIILDDITKGADEANNDDLHEGYWNKFTTEWWNRRENDRIKYIFAGTMWTPKDILNRITEKEERVSPSIEGKKFKYTWECEDGHAAFVRVPLLDDDDKSTCEVVMSTREALQLREITDEYLFSCVYQQNPIAPSGLEFAWENLRQFDGLPSDLKNFTSAVLDPTRKGKDNISMPIFRATPNNEDFYCVDWYYQKTAMTEAYDDIIDKIIEHHITDFVIENNTDTSLKSILEMKLKERNVYFCIIREKYNTIKKEVRIKDARGLIIRRMVFKKKGSMPPNSDYGRAMKALTTYSFDYANKNDDAPDSLGLFVNEIMEYNGKGTKATALDRGKLGL
jgi:hypothetical protein